MAESRRREKLAAQELAAQPFGYNPTPPRAFTSQAEILGKEGKFFGLKMAPKPPPLQDPVTGQLYFVPGISKPGGDDLLM